MTAVAALQGSRRARLLLGLALSVIFVALTVSRVDLGEVGRALGRVDPRGLVLAAGFVGLEFVARSIRWRRLLSPLAPVPLAQTGAYLANGYFATRMLPARLGDLARAFLAGRAFGLPRLTVLGTIVIERLADGLFILAAVVVLGVALTEGGAVLIDPRWIGALAAIGVAGLVVLIVILRSPGGGRLKALLRLIVARLVRGADAIRTPAGLAEVSGLTILAYGISVLTFSAVASAAGVDLSLAQCALAMGGVALSTSIPAAPGSIGTYEFVGVTILTSLGLPAGTALAVILLVHLEVTIPLSILGLVAAWRLHFRVSEIADDGEPSVLEPELR
jgi:uncharacterized membrane protein YbhN (UPF0104 family)